MVGVQAQDNFSTTAKAGIGAARGEQGGGGQGGGLPPGFDEAAIKLGITTAVLMQALGRPQGGPPAVAAAGAEVG
jgi:hypothetical protein